MESAVRARQKLLRHKPPFHSPATGPDSLWLAVLKIGATDRASCSLHCNGPASVDELPLLPFKHEVRIIQSGTALQRLYYCTDGLPAIAPDTGVLQVISCSGSGGDDISGKTEQTISSWSSVIILEGIKLSTSPGWRREEKEGAGRRKKRKNHHGIKDLQDHLIYLPDWQKRTLLLGEEKWLS